jgi:hypothetical protein
LSNTFNLACPSCDEDLLIDIQAKLWIRLRADGSAADESHDGSHEWDDSSPAYCGACDWRGTAGQLKKEETDGLV